VRDLPKERGGRVEVENTEELSGGGGNRPGKGGKKKTELPVELVCNKKISLDSKRGGRK